MSLTLEEAVAQVAAQVDQQIDDHLREFEARLRRDLAATGPEDEAALDDIPDPDSSWRRSTVEEAITLRRAQLHECLREILDRSRALMRNDASLPFRAAGDPPAA